MANDGWHTQAIREAKLLSYEAEPEGDNIKVEGYGVMDMKEFRQWLEQAKYIAGKSSGKLP